MEKLQSHGGNEIVKVFPLTRNGFGGIAEDRSANGGFLSAGVAQMAKVVIHTLEFLYFFAMRTNGFDKLRCGLRKAFGCLCIHDYEK